MSAADSLLEQVRLLSQVCLAARSEAVTDVVFRARTLATVDHVRLVAEVAVSAAEVDEILAEHREAERGPAGVTVRLTSAAAVCGAAALIRRGRDEVLYGWQLAAAGP